MKKIISLLLCFVFLSSLVSCEVIPITGTPPADDDAQKLKVFSSFINDCLGTDENGRASFLGLTDILTYNGKIISEVSSLQTNSNFNVNGFSYNGGSLYSFSTENTIRLDGTVVDTTEFFITDYVDGLALPFDISFGNTIDDVIKKITGLDIQKDFKADDGSDTDMTLISDDNGALIYRDLSGKQSDSDSSTPYEIVYSDEQIYKNQSGADVQRLGKVILSFDAFNNALVKVHVKVEDRHTIQVTQIPKPTPTPSPTPTVLPEVTGIYYDSKLSIAPYLDPDHTNPDILFENSLNKQADDRTLPIYVCDTFEDFDNFRRSFYGDINYDEKVESVYHNENIYSFVNNTMEYREDFFKDKSLILVYKRAGSGSNRYGSKCLEFNDSSLCVYVERTDNNLLGTDDVASWFISIEIDDRDLEGIKNFDARFYGNRW